MRFITKSIIVLLVCSALIMAVAPLVLKASLIYGFETQGYQVELKKLGINYLNAEVTLHDLALVSPSGGALRVYEAQWDWQPLRVLDKRWAFKTVSLKNLAVDIDGQGAGIKLAGRPLSDWLPLGDADAWPVDIQYLLASNASVCRMELGQCINMESASMARLGWQGRADGLRFEHRSPLNLSKAYLRDTNAQQSRFYVETLEVAGGLYEPGRAEIEGLALDNLYLVDNRRPAESTYQTQIGELRVDTLNWLSSEQRNAERGEDAPSGPAVNAELRIGSVEAVAWRQVMNWSEQGLKLWPRGLEAWFPELVRLSETGLSVRERPTDISVAGLAVDSGVLSWLDNTVSPPVRETLQKVRIRLGALASHAPEKATELHFSVHLPGEGDAKLEGDVYPFRSPWHYDLQGFVRELDLARWAAYTERAVGRRVSAGQLGVNLLLRADGERWRGDTRWLLSRIELAPSGARDGAMPLELALDVLADRNRTVDVVLPLTLDRRRETPSLAYVGRRLRNALTEQARAQMQAAGGARVESGRRPNTDAHLSFDPLQFPTQSREPTPADRQRLMSIAELLRQKPQLNLLLCPVSTAGEWVALFNDGQRPAAAPQPSAEQRRELRDLAVARGKTARALLEQAGVGASQIELCEPSLDLGELGPSFMTMTL